MPKWAKFIIAIFLLPVCLGAIRTLWRVIDAAGTADQTWVPFLAGAACWICVFLLLPKPMWLYVLGHEFTHALWTWLFGGKVKKFKATSRGGHVVVTRTNFLVALAPYFFPIYAWLLVVIFVIGHLIWNWKPFLAWFHLLTGAAYAFHVTLTAHIVKTRQTDITEQGYLFSIVIIFLGNISVLLIGIPLLTARVDLLKMFGWWFQNTGEVFQRLSKMV